MRGLTKPRHADASEQGAVVRFARGGTVSSPSLLTQLELMRKSERPNRVYQ